MFSCTTCDFEDMIKKQNFNIFNELQQKYNFFKKIVNTNTAFQTQDDWYEHLAREIKCALSKKYVFRVKVDRKMGE